MNPLPSPGGAAASQPAPAPDPRPRLYDVMAAKMRLVHYSIRTERSYIDWVKRFIAFHNGRHPRQMGAAEIESFLTHLAVEDLRIRT